MADWFEVDVTRWRAGARQKDSDRVVTEVPAALTYNRRSHVVMMVTPSNLEDFALGFSLTEGIIDEPPDLLSLRQIGREGGIELAMTVSERCFSRLEGQRRNLTGRTGCGLCGAESLEQAVHAPRAVDNGLRVTHDALERAVAAMQQPMPLQERTGAAHCAVWCDVTGKARAAREDVGRHNALDKLIGHLARQAVDTAQGFIVVSSRASYEMAYKTCASGAQLLLAASAPTALAIDYARASGLTLIGFARPGRHNVYTYPERVRERSGERNDGG